MAVEALLEVVFENLLSLVQNEFSTLYGLKAKTEKLSRTLDLIKAVIEDAEEKQIANRSIKVWLQQLKDAVYVLDDILDECSIQSLQLHGLSSFKPKNIMFLHRVGSRMKKITTRFDQIAEAKNRFLLCEGVKEWQSVVREWRQTSSTISQPQVFGRDQDKEKIVEFLLNQAQSSHSLSIYPIVGLGGVGKTTLAQLVYNDERVSTHFNIKIWVCVSENFSVKSILCSIIESIMEDKYNMLDLDVMEKKVKRLLQSRRYLLVLDDVWKRNQQLDFGLSQDKWNKLKSVLSCGINGSSILVLTRDESVAGIMGTCQPHHVSGLSEDDCWLLFKQCAFGTDKEERADLVAIGKEIIKKCGGLPLAAKALGGMMHSKNGKKEWLQVKESMLWTLEDENDILPALRLSYFHLTPTLKQCFAFCALFPKDKDIQKEGLIHLWMANGFISCGENLEAEDVGNMIWNELYQKSFFQDINIYGDLGHIYFKMHDLVHDLAQSVMGQECMILENANMNDLSKSTHHVSFGSGQLSFNKRAFKKAESLRTLYQLQLYYPSISSCFLPTISSLRVLRTSSFKLSSLGILIHLRYLELYGSEKTKTFPDSICSLRKLEILKLIYFPELTHLPKHLTRLQNLRHLVISDCNSLSQVSPNIGTLSRLRTLSVYIVSSKKGHSLEELSNLNLGGSLRIEGLENVGNVSEAQEANLKGKQDIQELCLSWNNNGETESDATTKAKQILEALQPHANLKILTILFYEGLHFPTWIMNNSNSTLNSLVSLTLSDCKICQQLPQLGKLPALRKLTIRGMDNVQYLDDDDKSYDGVKVSAFASLEQLLVSWLPNIEKLLKVERLEMFLCLSVMFISNCPKLRLPCIPSLRRLYVRGCNIELLRSICSLNGLTLLYLDGSEDLTFFPKGMMTNMSYLKSLQIANFKKLKELPCELMKLNTLEDLVINACAELESFPEQGWEGLRSLQTLEIYSCGKLRSLPEGVRHLASLENLSMEDCPALTAEDWHKIMHVPNVYLNNCGGLEQDDASSKCTSQYLHSHFDDE